MKRDDMLEEIGGGKWREADSADNDASDSLGNSRFISSTRLGKHFGLSAPRINQILSELGWIEKYVKGWVPTDRGIKMGAEVREMRQSGVPYVVWPRTIIDNRILLASIRELAGDGESKGSNPKDEREPEGKDHDFRRRFPAEHRAADGHWVRSRAEMLIDNWLYMQGIVHAVERKLPIEEEVYSEFYLPTGKVYIEYWGMEDDPRYAERMKSKLAIYEQYKLNLVQLHDADIMNLDDVLPRLLLKHGIDCT
ncbi:MAG: hypothetical protein JJU36_08720 [Phycisphaeraceae bacterium]|nr:hypothetical protein [Phycisphaeraceae bacterium]